MNNSSKAAVLKARIEHSSYYDCHTVLNNDYDSHFSHRGCEVCNIENNDSGGAGDVLNVTALLSSDFKIHEFNNVYDFEMCGNCFSSMVNGCDDDLL